MIDTTQTPRGTETELPPVIKEGENGTGIVPPIEPVEIPPVEAIPPVETPPAPPVETPIVPEPPVATPPAPVAEVDYKKKFGESTRENQIVMSRFNELQKVLGDITRKEVPTEDEMRGLEPDWDYLTDREKRDAMKMVVLERRQNLIFKTISDISLDSENARKLNEFIENEPRLKGKEDQFFDFATKPSHRGADMDTILKAFLFDFKETEVTPPVPTPTPTPTPESAPSLERGNPSAGAPQDIGKKELSADDLKALRTSDPRKYNEMVRKGLI